FQIVAYNVHAYPTDQVVGHADAVYFSDRLGNFVNRYDGVIVDGLAAGSGLLHGWHEDRGAHEYSCLYEGNGSRLTVRIQQPPGATPGRCRGELLLKLELLPLDTPSIAAKQRAAAEAKAAAEAAAADEEAQRHEEEEEEEHQAALLSQVAALS